MAQDICREVVQAMPFPFAIFSSESGNWNLLFSNDAYNRAFSDNIGIPTRPPCTSRGKTDIESCGRKYSAYSFYPSSEKLVIVALDVTAEREFDEAMLRLIGILI
jgi:hypothetical protein